MMMFGDDNVNEVSDDGNDKADDDRQDKLRKSGQMLSWDLTRSLAKFIIIMMRI